MLTVKVVTNVVFRKHYIFYYNVKSVEIIDKFAYLHFDDQSIENINLSNKELEIY